MSAIFHKGQLAVQKIAGEEEIAIQRIPMIKYSLHPRSIPFIEVPITPTLQPAQKRKGIPDLPFLCRLPKQSVIM